MRREEELEAIKLSADSDTLPEEMERRRQELKESKGSVDSLTHQLKSLDSLYFVYGFYFSLIISSSKLKWCSAGVLENLDSLKRKQREIKNSIEKMKVLF